MNKSNYAADIQQLTLDNGMQIYFMPVLGRNALSFSLTLTDRFVCVAEDPGAKALAVVAGEALLKGSKNFDLEAICEAFDEMCIPGVKFRSSSQNLTFSTTIVKQDFSKLLEIICDALANPDFNDEELEIIKNQSLGFYLNQKSDTGHLAWVSACQKLYNPDSWFYSSDCDTVIDCIKKIDSASSRSYLNRILGGHHQHAIIVGDINIDNLKEILNRTLGKLSLQTHSLGTYIEESETAFRTDNGNSVVRTDICGKSSTDIKIIFPLMLDRQHPDFEACLVAANILGGDTMGSRLGKRVRVKEGLTYGINCSFSDFIHVNSPIIIDVTVNPKNVDKALSSIDTVMQEFLANGVSQMEIDEEVNSMVNQVKISRRTVVALCNAIQLSIMQGLDLTSLDDFESKLRNLKLESVNLAISKYFKPAYQNYKITSIAGS